MSIAIQYWKISIFEDRNAEAALIGYQSTPEIEVVNGYVLVKDYSQITTHGFPLNDAAGFKIEPVYNEDGINIEPPEKTFFNKEQPTNARQDYIKYEVQAAIERELKPSGKIWNITRGR